MRYRDLMGEQRDATKQILLSFEELVIKYKISMDDYNNLRAVIKSKSFRISNVWHRFFATVVDAKFERKINENGEKIETHNGENKSE